MQPIHTPALIIGAGPVGLWQAFQLGLQGLRCHIVDALPQAGGQCAELYPHKPIYDIPALPHTTGRALVDHLLHQVAPFAPTFHFGQLVEGLQVQEPLAGGGFMATTSTGQAWLAQTVFIAAGVGAFMPRKLTIDGAEAFTQAFTHNTPQSVTPSAPQIFYQLPTAEAIRDGLKGKRVVVVGGDDRALAWAAQLHAVASTILLHRRAEYQADPAAAAAIHSLAEGGKLQCVTGQVQGFVQDFAQAAPNAANQSNKPNPPFSALEIMTPEGETRTLPCDVLLVSLGLSPKLGPIADWGLVLERKQLTVDTATFETPTPGIYAVGDINTYPGKRKLIVSGFHEATLAAFAAAERLNGTPSPTLYTTASAVLHQRLGISAA